MNELKDKIRQARKSAGMTQIELAKKLNTTAQNISQYETGTRKPKLETLARIAEALGVDITEFIPLQTFPDGKSFDEAWKKATSTSDDQLIIEHHADGTTSIHNGTDRGKIDSRLDHLNDNGIKEALHQLDLLSQIPDFKKSE